LIQKPLSQANVPLSEMFQYVSNLRGMTKGRAQYSMQLEKYEVVPPQVRPLKTLFVNCALCI